MSRSSVSVGLPVDNNASPAQIWKALTAMLAAAHLSGERFLDVTSGGLHRSTGGDKGSSKGVARCCRVMNNMMSAGDSELSSSRGATTKTLLIRYALPRWTSPVRPAPAPE